MKQSGAGSYLAFDLGASSGRAVVGTLDGSVMRMAEIHRFRTPMLEENGHLYWDIHALWADIRVGVAKAFDAVGALRSISVDSWAVDYVPLDARGNALRNPYCYRDTRTAGRLDTAIRLAGGADALYDRTGIQFLPFNTLPQVIADIEDEPDLVRATTTRLLIAEYFLYRLSGRKVAEATMASTTQLVDARSGQWSASLIAAIGDDEKRWPPIVPCGTALGPLLPSFVADGVTEAPIVLATCAHDTAAAVAAVPATPGRNWAFISSGTWSLVGAELDSPVLTREAKFAFVDDGPGKPVGIYRHIGKRPILAFGNSDGDLQMLQVTTAGEGRRLALIVHHDDAQREFAYDRESHVGKLDKALDAAPANHWLVVSMQKDWKRIFGFQQ